MNTNLTLRLALYLFAAIPAMVATGEPPVRGSAGPMLVETDSQNATHMLQLRWKTHVTGCYQTLFWFTDSNLPRRDQTRLDEDEPAFSDDSFATGEIHGGKNVIHVKVRVEEISRAHVGIKVSIGKGNWVDENPVMEVEELLKIPPTSVGPTMQGRIAYTARWWCIAQPSHAPEPRSEHGKMKTSPGAAW